jgi:selenide,water dikinase
MVTTYYLTLYNILAGVFAVRAGPILKDNLIAYLLQQPLTTHTPQQEFLGLITTGDKYAVASRGEHALEGAFLWDLKDQIDRSFMDTFLQLPSMDPMDTTSDESDTTALNQRNFIPPNLNIHGIDALSAFASSSMRCGGCGSKVGSTTLSRVLNFVYQRRHRIRKSLGLSNILPDIPQDDAAVIMLPEHRGIPGKDAMVHTIDFFRSFISDPYIFGKVAAVHAMSDCHAMGCQPETALALAVCKFHLLQYSRSSF